MDAGGLRLYLALEAMTAGRENSNATLVPNESCDKGKSALSALRANVSAHMHAFADPSISFADDELRNQGVELRYKIVRRASRDV